MVTVGWIVTAEVSIGNSRRQHTIALITQHAFDPARATNRALIKATLPTYETKLTPHLAAFTDETSAFLQAIDLELNFYRQTDDYIVFWRTKSARTWTGLSSMYTRWKGV